MADGDNDIFVYLGGEQEVPDGVTHAIIDPSVNIVRRRAFYKRKRLVSVIFHDGVEIIEQEAFWNCLSLRGTIKLLGVRDIRKGAFCYCRALKDVEFGDRLETVGSNAFRYCECLGSIKSLSVRTVQAEAFCYCEALTDVEFGINLETIDVNSFYNCPRLRRIAIPLKDGLFRFDDLFHRYTQFDNCSNLTMVDIVGAEAIHTTISSLLLDSWRDDMKAKINRINRELPNTNSRVARGNAIQVWVRLVINRMEHYKAEHNRLLKEHMTLLELAVWKAKLDEEEEDSTLKVHATKRAKIDEESAKEEKRITSGADIIIKNVLPFLKLA